MHPRLRLFLCIVISLVLMINGSAFFSNASQISGPHFTDIIVTTSDSDLLLFGELRNSLTDEMVNGLHSGIPVQFTFFVELEKIKQSWFDTQLTELTFSHALSYDTLKESYTVKTEESSKKELSVGTLDEAVKLLNEINGLKIIELSRLEPNKAYRLRVKADLYRKTLPLSLHKIIPFISWWDVKTDWHSVEFLY